MKNRMFRVMVIVSITQTRYRNMLEANAPKGMASTLLDASGRRQTGPASIALIGG